MAQQFLLIRQDINFSDSCTLADIELTSEKIRSRWLVNACDTDDDNDGLIDTADNCPTAPNNGPVYYYPDHDGFVKDGLLGPLGTGTAETTGVMSDLINTSPESLTPSLGDEEDVWDDLPRCGHYFAQPQIDQFFRARRVLVSECPKRGFCHILYSDYAYDSQD